MEVAGDIPRRFSLVSMMDFSDEPRPAQKQFRKLGSSAALAGFIGLPLGHVISNDLLGFDDQAGIGAIVGALVFALIAYFVYWRGAGD